MPGKPKYSPDSAPVSRDGGIHASNIPDADRTIGIKDIARELGISIGTVDRAIHSRGGISSITKERVLKMAQTLGYQPNLAARYLKSPRQIRVSVNLPLRIQSFFDAIRGGIRDSAAPLRAGVDLRFRTHPALGVGEEEVFRKALDDDSRGIIIAPGNPTRLKVWIRKAAQRRIPVVCVSTDAPGTERLTAVSADPFVSGAVVAELLQLTVRDSGSTAVLVGDLSTIDHSEKVRGFKSSIESFSDSLKLSSVVETHDDETIAYNQTRKLVAKDRALRAIYVSTANSIPALRALEELDPERRIRIVTTDLFPELLPFLKSGRVLATMYQRPEAQGRMAFEALYQFLVEGKCPPRQIKLNPHIVMRSNLELFLNRIADSSKTSHFEQAPTSV